ncbi:MAG: EamA family transporter, partial [Methylomonas sp.]|nr:EamA family transporter [Methylomonas sp.]
SATTVALITLITPVFSLALGWSVNQEPVTLQVASGAGLILSAVALHTWMDKRQRQSSVR